MHDTTLSADVVIAAVPAVVKFYRGAAVPLLTLLKARQQRLLQAGLINLRQQLQVAYYSAP